MFVAASVAEWANETDITPEHGAAAAEANGAQAIGLTKAIRAARKFDPVLDKLDASDRRQLTLLKYSGQPAPDDPKAAQELAKIAEEMTVGLRQGRVHRDAQLGAEGSARRWQREVHRRRGVVEEARGREEAGRACSPRGRAGTTRSATPRAVVRAVRRARRTQARTTSASTTSRRCGSPATTCPTISSRPTSIGCGARSSRSTISCTATRGAQLNKKYGDKVVSKTGPIPAHLFGNMWAQSWGYLYQELEPFKGVAAIDVTPELVKQKYDAKKMVQMGEAFYTSLGMPPLPDDVLAALDVRASRPARTSCATRARGTSTFSDDLRIKMCINIEPGGSVDDPPRARPRLLLRRVLQAADPVPGRRERRLPRGDRRHDPAVDDARLPQREGPARRRSSTNEKGDAQPPDAGRAREGRVPAVRTDDRQVAVGRVRRQGQTRPVQPALVGSPKLKYQGIVPPIARSASDFDPGAKFHVASNTPYMRYFLADGPAVPVSSRAVQEGRVQRAAQRVLDLQQQGSGRGATRRCSRSARASRGRTRCSR